MSSHLYSKPIVGKRVIIFIWCILESADTVLNCALTSVAFRLCGIFKVIMGLTRNAAASYKGGKRDFLLNAVLWRSVFPLQTLILYLQTGLYRIEPTFQGKWQKCLHFSESFLILFGIRRERTQLSELLTAAQVQVLTTQSRNRHKMLLKMNCGSRKFKITTNK